MMLKILSSFQLRKMCLRPLCLVAVRFSASYQEHFLLCSYSDVNLTQAEGLNQKLSSAYGTG